MTFSLGHVSIEAQPSIYLFMSLFFDTIQRNRSWETICRHDDETTVYAVMHIISLYTY